MSTRTTGSVKHWTAAELRKLPESQRDAILEAAAAAAEKDYKNDAELTAFEAFGKEGQPRGVHPYATYCV